jgi:hypothetical protein
MNRTSMDDPQQQQQDEGNGVGPHERMRHQERGRTFDPARLRELGGRLGAQLEAQARKHPYATISAAAGLGFVAGSLFGSKLGQVALAAGVGYVAKNVLEGDLAVELLRQAIEKLAPERT